MSMSCKACPQFADASCDHDWKAMHSPGAEIASVLSTWYEVLCTWLRLHTVDLQTDAHEAAYPFP